MSLGATKWCARANERNEMNGMKRVNARAITAPKSTAARARRHCGSRNATIARMLHRFIPTKPIAIGRPQHGTCVCDGIGVMKTVKLQHQRLQYNAMNAKR